MNKRLYAFFVLAFIITCISALAYGLVQQNVRFSANDPQIQVAEDIADSINNGILPETLIPTNKVELSKSLSPFIVIYDKNNKILATNASLHSQEIYPPAGVLEYAKKYGQNRITWMPEKGLRFATVITHYTNGDGTVLVGRSLRETENRQLMLIKKAVFGWIFTLVGSFIFVMSFAKFDKKFK